MAKLGGSAGVDVSPHLFQDRAPNSCVWQASIREIANAHWSVLAQAPATHRVSAEQLLEATWHRLVGTDAVIDSSITVNPDHHAQDRLQQGLQAAMESDRVQRTANGRFIASGVCWPVTYRPSFPTRARPDDA
ncbi:hypothetical protein [Auritidibacter ignavus]|uniref:hypothetical protein n=1 Tax=Auritidibacter ignavus TaxID=678932 RepID=UPI0010A4CA85|nr:hypothetical protein [Auritidibacter ignavus]